MLLGRRAGTLSGIRVLLEKCCVYGEEQYEVFGPLL